MHVKFRITFEDDTTFESHDGAYNWLYDHSHALPPHQDKVWKQYELISDEGHILKVDFHTGVFWLKNKDEKELTPTYVQDKDGSLLVNRSEKQNFAKVSDPWKLLNGLEYFPVVGRRYQKGDWGELMSFFCGWKIKMKEENNKPRTIQVTYHIYPHDGSIMPEIT